MAYAVDTDVPVERTRAEIERLIAKHKCSAYMSGTDHIERRAMVQFRAHNRIVRFVLQLPDPTDKQFARNGRGLSRTPQQRQRACDQSERSKWRALLLVIKAKLEAVESNIATFEEEFLAHIVLPNDRTVAENILPMIARAYDSGVMPSRMLPAAVTGETIEGEAVTQP
jgi:hypothetical protein